MALGKRIIENAIENGASLAGIASMKALRASPSQRIYNYMLDNVGNDIFKDVEDLPDDEFTPSSQPPQSKKLFQWPDTVQSVLVIGLSHPREEPVLDWWDGKGTLGNRVMIDIIKRSSHFIENSLKVNTHKLHYYVEKGGVFLKDAAVFAGLGCIGRNNMLITPSNGPRVRLRALFIDAHIQPTGPTDFDPCIQCKVNCRTVCPEGAMTGKASLFQSVNFLEDLPARDGSYSRKRCKGRMEKDVDEGSKNTFGQQSTIKFCRICEFICPVGQ